MEALPDQSLHQLHSFNKDRGRRLLTCAVAAVSVRVQTPAWVTGALDRGLVLLTDLAAPQVAAAVVHHLTRLVAGVQIQPRWAGAHHTFPWCHGALMTAAPPGYEAQICIKRGRSQT